MRQRDRLTAGITFLTVLSTTTSLAVADPVAPTDTHPPGAEQTGCVVRHSGATRAESTQARSKTHSDAALILAPREQCL